MTAVIPSRTFAIDRPVDPIFIIIAALLPFTQLIEINFIGRLLLQDLVAPVLLLMLLASRDAMQRLGELSLVLLLILVWLAGAIITDVYRNTPFADLSRGWSRITLFLVHTTMLWLLSNGRLSVLGTYFLSLGVAGIFAAYLIPSEYAESDIWKFGLGSGLLLIVGALSVWPSVKVALGGYLPSLLIGMLGFVSLTQDSRSLFAICALAAGYSAVSVTLASRPKLAAKVTPGVFAGVILGGLIGSQLIVQLYGYAARSGLLGEAAFQKFMFQTQGATGILLGGRSETLVSVQAILDSPVLGHGSWAQDAYYVRLYFARLTELGLPAPYAYYIENFGFLIPSHSYLFGSWVEAGILGVPIWIGLLVLTVRALYLSLKIQAIPNALVSIAAFSLFWDIPFSPFGSSSRFLVAAQLCIMLSAIQALRNHNSELRATETRGTSAR